MPHKQWNAVGFCSAFVHRCAQHGSEDLDDLPVAVIGACKSATHATKGAGQHPVLEGGTAALRVGLFRQHWHEMPGVVDRLSLGEAAFVFADKLAVLFDNDAVCTGINVDGESNRLGHHRILVIVKGDETGLGGPCRHTTNAIERASIGDDTCALGFEHLEHRALLLLRGAKMNADYPRKEVEITCRLTSWTEDETGIFHL